MEIRSTIYRTATRHIRRHDPAKCPGPPYSSRCYTLDTDKRIVTRFYGIEQIEDEELAVTSRFDTEADVVEPSEQEKGDYIGQEKLLEILERTSRRRALINAATSPQAAAALDDAITQTQGMIR